MPKRDVTHLHSSPVEKSQHGPVYLLTTQAKILNGAPGLNTLCNGKQITLQFKYQEKPFPERMMKV